MEIILKKDIDKLGNAMDIINVKDGYARNYLIPEGLAVHATDGNRKSISDIKEAEQRRMKKKKKEAQKIAKKIENVPCTISVKTGEDNKIFGSVTSRDIAGYLTKEGFDVSKQDIMLEEPIKELGVYNIKIRMLAEVYAKLKVWVVKEEDREDTEES